MDIIFPPLDTNGNHQISLVEYTGHLTGIVAAFTALDTTAPTGKLTAGVELTALFVSLTGTTPTSTELAAMMTKVDLDSDGAVDQDEWTLMRFEYQTRFSSLPTQGQPVSDSAGQTVNRLALAKDVLGHSPRSTAEAELLHEWLDRDGDGAVSEAEYNLALLSKQSVDFEAVVNEFSSHDTSQGAGDSELIKGTEIPEMFVRLTGRGATPSEIQAVMNSYDTDKDSLLSEAEYAAMVVPLRRAMAAMDKGADVLVGMQNITFASHVLGRPPRSVHEVSLLYEHFDTNMDGVITQNEYVGGFISTGGAIIS